MEQAVRVRDLTRTFKVNRRREQITALDGVDLEIGEGELFGLLGPNGAGKTTLIKILATLLLPSSGTAEVLGYDVMRESSRIRPLINMVSGGEISGYGLLTVRENLWMFSQFYGIPGKEARRRIDSLLHNFGLEEKADAKVRTISTGERQKMNVIRGFVTDPKLIFLDEPTVGLDVNSARAIRAYIDGWVRSDEGRTVLLTTHYMAEAEELCDRIAIIDQGRILACDTPANLKRMVNQVSAFIIETTHFDNPEALAGYEGVRGITAKTNASGLSLRLLTEDESVIADLVSHIVGEGAKITHISKSEPTLEDVFVRLVGRGLG